MASRDIKSLHKELQFKYMKFAGAMAEAQVPFIITCTYRSQAEQDDLFAQGRSKPGKIVTWVRKSNHSNMEGDIQASKAFDIAIVHEKKPTWDLKVDVDKDEYPDYAEAAEIGRRIGLKAGADFGDYCHFELIEKELPQVRPDAEPERKIDAKEEKKIERPSIFTLIKDYLKVKKAGETMKKGVTTSEYLLVILFVAIVIANDHFGLNLSPNTVEWIFNGTVGWVIARTGLKATDIIATAYKYMKAGDK